jgi:hypothetical protein
MPIPGFRTNVFVFEWHFETTTLESKKKKRITDERERERESESEKQTRVSGEFRDFHQRRSIVRNRSAALFDPAKPCDVMYKIVVTSQFLPAGS